MSDAELYTAILYWLRELKTTFACDMDSAELAELEALTTEVDLRMKERP